MPSVAFSHSDPSPHVVPAKRTTQCKPVQQRPLPGTPDPVTPLDLILVIAFGTIRNSDLFVHPFLSSPWDVSSVGASTCSVHTHGVPSMYNGTVITLRQVAHCCPEPASQTATAEPSLDRRDHLAPEDTWVHDVCDRPRGAVTAA